MTCSPARLAANRANALKSTGPRTEEGKARSRANALKHGLTGGGVALPEEDAAAVAARFEAIRDDLRPRTALGSVLAHRAALLSVRLDRCRRREAAALANRVGRAAADFDEARHAEVHRLVGLLDEDPAGAVRNLRRMPEGVDRMLAGWEALRCEVGPGPVRHWCDTECSIADRLSGRPPMAIGVSRIEALYRAGGGDFRHLEPGEGEGLDDEARRDWAEARLGEVVDARIAELKAHRATLDLDAIARERSRAADAALFDASKEAVLARKYEAATERSLFRTLRELRQVEGEADDPEPEAESESDPQAEGLASFSPAGPEGSRRPRTGRPDPRRLREDGREWRRRRPPC